MTQEEFLVFQSHLIAQIIDAPFEDAIRTYAQNFPFLTNINFILPNPQRLREIIQLYKRKAAAFNKETLAKHISYVTDLLDPEVKQRYCTAEAFVNRRNRIQHLSQKGMLELLEK